MKSTAAAVFLLFLFSPGPTQAKKPSESMEIPDDLTSSAKEVFDRGVLLFNAKDYKGALENFLKSYKMHAHFKIRYNIGLCYIHLEKFVLAAGEFEALLEENGESLDVELRGAVQKALVSAQAKVCTVSFEVDVEGADIVVDGQSAGVSPLGRRLFLDPGKHEVNITSPQGHEWAGSIDVAAGDKMQINVIMADVKKKAKVETVVQEPVDGKADKKAKKKKERKPLKVKKIHKAYFYTALGLTAAAAVVGAVTGGLALMKSGEIEDLDNECENAGCNAQYWDEYDRYLSKRQDLYDEADTLSKVSTAFLIATGGFAAASLTLFFFTGPWKKEKSPAARMDPVIVVSGRGLVFSMRF
jgi:tetratricopeptide (TPR) repeat protein